MIHARIFSTLKSAAQSGRAKEGHWILEVSGTPGSIRDLETAWNSTADTLRQITLKFDSLEDARAFADRHQLRYTIETTKSASPRRRTYAENFRHA
jgi:hypothetical protein